MMQMIMNRSNPLDLIRRKATLLNLELVVILQQREVSASFFYSSSLKELSVDISNSGNSEALLAG